MPTVFHRRGLLGAASGLALSALVASAAMAQAAPPLPKAVFQVSDGDAPRWNLALNNLRNVQDDLGGPDGVELELVTYGPGVGMLKADSPVAARIAAALKAGVKVVACENSMRNQKLTPADMLPGIAYVPSGVVELMKRQREGWSYIRP
jgi:intracellular sulfur oxidation DsrE/DsrF family protein